MNTSFKVGAGAFVGFHVIGLSKGPSSVFGSTSKAGLAAGMIGGPTGFEGCERYQYGAATRMCRSLGDWLSQGRQTGNGSFFGRNRNKDYTR